MNEMNERIAIVSKLYQDKIAYAKQYHGEHYHELEHLYQQATEAYVRSNSLCQEQFLMSRRSRRRTKDRTYSIVL